MKKLSIAAAALLLGTSAYAFVPSPEPTHPATVAPTSAVGPVYGEAPALQPTAVDTWMTAEPAAYTADDTEPALKTAAADDVKAAEMAGQTAKADAQLAAHENAFAADVDDAMNAPAVETATVEPVETAAMTGMGGPYEAVDTAAADLTPRPAAQNYPACRPGPGDDNCIQLYEPGVQERLASWTQPTGGFAGTAGTQVAMGGPYEPVDDAAMTQESAVVGDGNVDTARGETPADEDVAEV